MHAVYADTHHLMTSDALTGLFNHGFLHARLARQIEGANEGFQIRGGGSD